ncbi:hypothetical protein [Streptomyces lasiicapitis]|uniref:hypothetical protein n=1 Tax=Streptomyces lasiicapitis TaxID=1923961 RepID=UPI00365A36D4
MTTTAEQRRITTWLARTHPLPQQAHAEWAFRGVALLPLGRRFDAIRVPTERVHAAVGSSDPDVVAATLAEWLDGPVIRDTRHSNGAYYVLVRPGAQWDGAEEYLGKDTYLGVPRIGDVTMLAAWVVQPRHPGNVCDVAHLRALLATAEPLKAIDP